MSIKYTEDHEWLKVDGDTAIVGITHHAQDALGDVVFVDLPEVGKTYAQKETAGVVESVKAAARKKAAEGTVMSDDERRKLVSTEQSLGMAPDARMPSGLSGLEVVGDEEKDESRPSDFSDADSFFNLPGGSHDDEDEDDDHRR